MYVIYKNSYHYLGENLDWEGQARHQRGQGICICLANKL